jgi:hypothetical protein
MSTYISCNARALACGLLTAALAPQAASAGAWTWPQGQGQAIETLTGWIGSGWGTGAASRENRLETQTYLEYGLWDRLTLVGQISYERYALSPPTRDVYTGFDYSGGGLRARVWQNDAWVFSLEAGAFVSGATDPKRPAQAGNTGPGPEIDMRALLGHAMTLWGRPAFLDAQAGYRLRQSGPPDEFHADLTLGVDATPRAQILAQVFNTVSNGAGAQAFPAWEGHVGQLSLVYALDDLWKLQFGGFGTLYRRNTNSEYGLTVAVWRRF